MRALALLLALSACGDSQIDLIIGTTADDQFLPLAPGDPMQILIGPQLGVMLAPALRARNLNPGDDEGDADPEVHWQIWVGPAMEAEQVYRLPFKPAGQGVYDRRAIPIRLSSYQADTVGELSGRTVTLTVEVHDSDGGRGATETSVVAMHTAP
jgi:hypothetical protein